MEQLASNLGPVRGGGGGGCEKRNRKERGTNTGHVPEEKKGGGRIQTKPGGQREPVAPSTGKNAPKGKASNFIRAGNLTKKKEKVPISEHAKKEMALRPAVGVSQKKKKKRADR